MAVTYGSFTEASANALLALTGGGLPPCVGTRRYVNKSSGSNTYDGSAPDEALATITRGLELSVSGDQIVVAPGSYDEAISTTKSGIAIVGAGNLGQVSIAPSATNAVAFTVTGTSSLRAQAISLYNIGLEGNGTGGAFYAVGNIRTMRLIGCKVEGGAFAVKLESTAAGSVADTKILGSELCWATYGVQLLVSGGGDPVTQTLIQGGLIHNIVTAGVMNVTTHSADVWIDSVLFLNQEDGTAPTKYLDIAVASTTGIVSNCTFATTVQASSVLGIASGVIWVNNRTQAEQPGTDAFATSGRPD